MPRGLYAATDIKKGDSISKDHLVALRPAKGLSASMYFSILGRKWSKDLWKVIQYLIIAMNNYPKVSICIPCFNSEFYIEACIASCLDQATNFLINIVCDDCSTDKSYDILQSNFAHCSNLESFKIPRIRCRRN